MAWDPVLLPRPRPHGTCPKGAPRGRVAQWAPIPPTRLPGPRVQLDPSGQGFLGSPREPMAPLAKRDQVSGEVWLKYWDYTRLPTMINGH